MAVKLMNSKMMPAEGIYELKRIEADEFTDLVRKSNSDLESYIGYQQTAELISRMSGIKIPVNRSATPIADGDVMLIAALNYRPDAPTKGAPVNESDFEFFIAFYRNLV